MTATNATDQANRVVGLLYDRRGEFYPLSDLAAAASLDRGRLEEAIGALERRGHVLELSPACGARLVSPVRLDPHLIGRDLGTQRIGRNVICFDEVGSTNDVARGAAAEDADGLVVTAELQSAGRGRQGRRWLSPAGANILASVVLWGSPDELPCEALTIAAGLAIAEGVEAACGLPCRLKWPNDILAEEAKLAGVLVETFGVRGGRCVIIGLGVNVNAAPPAEDLDCLAACLKARLDHDVERIEVLRRTLQELDAWRGQVAAGDLDELHSRWVARCGMINERVTIASGGRRITGRVLDVSPLDGLVLACDSGQTVRLPAAGSTVVA